MNKKNHLLLHFDIDDSNMHPRCLQASCANAIDIVTILNIDSNLYKKAKLINHIYACQACRSQFKEYLSLLDKTESFCNLSGNILQRHTPSQKRNYFSVIFQPRSLVYALFTLFVATLAVLLYFSPNDDNLKVIPSQIRGFSSPLTDVFPKPFSSVTRELLNFKWGSMGQSIPQGICLYDSDLELIWESEYSLRKTIILPSQLKSRLLINHQYYWTIKSKSESGTEIFSVLFPFSLKD